MTGANDATPRPAARGGLVHLLFGYRGRIGRAQYWTGLGLALIALALALILGGVAMSSTGGNSVVLLALPLLAIFVWIHAAVTTKRLRDAGLQGWAYLAFVAAPLLAMAAAIEFIEFAWFMILAALIAVLAIPGLMKSKTT